MKINTSVQQAQPANKKGRPARVDRLVEKLIGVVGVSVLKENDLYVVPGKLLRDLTASLPEPEKQEEAEEAAG